MGRDVPVIIIKDDAEMADIPTDMRKKDGIIILTRDDLKQGADVFALTFVHMKEYCTLLKGKDRLANLDIKKKHVRHHIETLARQMLIDTREYEYTKATRSSVRDHCLLALHRIASGYRFLFGEKHPLTYDEVNDLTSFKTKLLAITEYIDTNK
ncbi:MAG: hypothetical protein H6766_00545 [Candidatus Peribacteria bacterium]|nr:MAG: hypothetical protein H6766_00545 [Candidatus Peribacteria bacterium]